MTGGVLPAAAAADHVVTRWDQNVQVHAPHQSVATRVEWCAGAMLCQLLGLRGERWRGRAFTTGATASNVLGLGCGREGVLRGKAWGGSGEGVLGGREDGEAGSGGVGELGLLEACRVAGVEEFQVLTTMGHSSLSKAASIVGLGRKSVVDVGLASTPWRFDMEKLERMLARPRTASIVVVSCGEVNTGRYAMSGYAEMERLRQVCDRFEAWLHVDGGTGSYSLFHHGVEFLLNLNSAFGIFARALPAGDEFALLREACEGIELADSITGDAHKCLNVVSLYSLPPLPFPKTHP